MKIVVLGGGNQGRVIATDLARSLPSDAITVADLRRPPLPPLGNLNAIEADLSDRATVVRMMREHDFAVGALPSKYGTATMRAAIEAGRNLVDVSFAAEDPTTLNAEARRAGVTIIPDAGLAPGISNLVIGRVVAEQGPPDELVILVGGVAQDASKPYGYCVTWSLEDLVEEYTRPARILQNGAVATVPVFSGYERLTVDGVGELEAFYSDGLRTLLHTVPGVPEMGEKTLRWPGHMEAIQPLVAAGTMVATLRERCTLDPPEDLVVLLIRFRRGRNWERVTMVDRYDPATRMTSMSRTTALTTSVCAQLVAAGLTPPAGVQPLEKVGADARSFEFIRERLAARGVRFAVPPVPETATNTAFRS
jgi:saccharopine dehydrogenase-like NADP-dependent oxidoreductase